MPVACGDGGEQAADRAGEPLATEQADGGQSAGLGEINTPVGTFIVKNVGVPHLLGYLEADPGHQILGVTLVPEDAGQTVSDAAKQEIDSLLDGAYIVGSDGSRVGTWGRTWIEAGDGSDRVTILWVSFTPPVSSHNFKLFWPGSQPVDLGE